MVDSSAISGSGQVLNINTSSIANSLVNSLNSFAPKGYFILQQQFGISPFLAFILVGLAIMMLYYLAAYIFFTKLFKDGQELFENIKVPLLVFVFSLGFLSAYAVGFLVYIFEIVLIALVVSLFILIIIAIFTGGLGGYRAGGFLVHKITTIFYEAAKERYDMQMRVHGVIETAKKLKKLSKKGISKEPKELIDSFLNEVENTINRLRKEFNEFINVLEKISRSVKNIRENIIEKGIGTNLEAILKAIQAVMSREDVREDVKAKLADAYRILKNAIGLYDSIYNSLKTLENLPQNFDNRQRLELVMNVPSLISQFEENINKLINEFENSTAVSDDIKREIKVYGQNIKNYIDQIRPEIEKNLLPSIQKADINYFVNELKDVVNKINTAIMFLKALFYYPEDVKNEINNKIDGLNGEINKFKAELGKYGADVNQIGLLQKI